jgi:hypothetical protein
LRDAQILVTQETAPAHCGSGDKARKPNLKARAVKRDLHVCDKTEIKLKIKLKFKTVVLTSTTKILKPKRKTVLDLS